MNKIYLLFVCCFLTLAASAVTTYYPISISAPYSGTGYSVCQNANNSAATVTYTSCGTTAAVGSLTVTATWYIGGTLMYTDPTPHVITATTGSISLPANAFSYSTFGTFTGAGNGLYCVLSWTSGGASPCTGFTSAQGTSTDVTVNQTPTAITGTPAVCTGATTSLSSTPAGGVWSSSNTAIGTVAFSTGVVGGIAAGNIHISYTLGSGCATNVAFTVNQTPAAITGTFSLCDGTLTTLHDGTVGGTWSSTNLAVGTIGAGTGGFNALSAGTTTVSYIMPTGCNIATTVTVNQSPALITGPGTVCSGSTINLTDAVAGGVFTSSNTSVATVNFSTGDVTGVGVGGTATISYTLSSGCKTFALVTVYPLPAAISGTTSMCENGLISLSDVTAGGNWSTSNGNVMIGTGSGFATSFSGAGPGLDTIFYTLSTGCFKSVVVTVNPLPGTINGTTVICAGSTTTLTNSVTGGAWTSSATSVATIASTGVVTGVASGVTIITYKLSTGCYVTTSFTVNALPAAITGPTSLCEGTLITLSDAITGGTWSSGSTGVASIGSGSGVLAGISAGISTIDYTLSTGCFKSVNVTVNAVPAAISGANSVCVGTTTTLSDVTIGGTWSSNPTSVATISTSGVVNGVAFGTAIITYKVSTGCQTTMNITVNSNPSAITGITHVCVGSNTSLTDASSGGNWTSSNIGVGTVDVIGTVSGLAAGTTTITYTITTGCRAITNVTVNPLPVTITGAGVVCVGSSITLSDVTAGGTFSSVTPGVATVTSAGVVGGVSGGTDVINYTITATGCAVSKTITVNPLPTAITGTQVVCIGAITSLTNTTGGGNWSSSNTAKAVVDGSGNVTGVATGTATITYALSTGCQTTIAVTVNTLPATISGVGSVCELSTITLSDATTGGTWSSTNTGVATVTSGGIVTGVVSGSADIVYTLSTGCARSTTITVNPVPSAILGTLTICAGTTTTLTDAAPSGVWSSGTTSVATIGFSTGLVTAGATAGTTNITYTLGTGCKTTSVFTVTALPATIAGPANVCIGSIITLSDATTGGTWSSADPSIGSVGVGTGIVTGVSAGTTTISYTVPSGCYRTLVINVNPFPGTITGASEVCQGSGTVLSDPTAGGTWTSSTTTIATINLSSGFLTGVAAGSVNITYTLSTGCNTVTNITVDPLPASITGSMSMCVGLTTALGDAAFPGTWSSSNVTVGTVDATTGIVTGIAAGTARITFTLGTGCYKTAVVTVNQLPSAITGNTSICSGPATSGLGDLSSGGTWSSSNTGVATITSAGLVTPVAAGTSTITYTLATSCYTTTTITVNTTPSAITGSPHVCAGQTTTLSDPTIGGSWVSSNTTIATVDGSTGVVSGIVAGQAIISYILPTGCNATIIFTVNPLPAPITGTTYLCEGGITSLSDVTPGGTWSSDNGAVATVSGGVVTGVDSGIATISYIPLTGCNTTVIVSVNPRPTPILGSLAICTSQTLQLSDETPGGIWISGNNSIATTGTLSGTVTGVSGGNATISYVLGTSCYTTVQVTVAQAPASISGPSNVCAGGIHTISLSDATPGGHWTTSDPTVATVGFSTGIVTGEFVSGADTIMYTTGAGSACTIFKIITVNFIPNPIVGPTNICTGAVDTLLNTTPGGTWTSSSSAKATVGLTSGIVNGIDSGIVHISYTLGSGCYVEIADTVNKRPFAIMGASNVCEGLTITLSDATPSGLWSSSDASTAAIDVSLGVVTGGLAGSATITYTVNTGCIVTSIINVNPKPSAILGSLSQCAGFSTTLSDLTPGGVWISSNPGVASIGVSTGFVSGVSTGTSTITYKLLATGCQTTGIATVNPVPGPIQGITNVCVGSTINLSDTTVLGTWSSNNTAVATIGSLTGDVFGVDSGFTTITYTGPSGCIRTTLIRVNVVPAPIVGADTLCPGVITTFTDVTPFGIWTSSDTSIIAVIDGFTGNVTGLVPGTTVITYMLGTGCFSTLQVTVNPLPAPIVGSPIVCVGATLSMSDATAGGLWGSTNPSVAIVSGAGDVTGIAPGYDTLTYTLSTGCMVSHYITVSATSSPILGDTIICVGDMDTLTSTPPGGAWSSGNIIIATVGSGTGVVTGNSAGVALITYTTLAGCKTNFYVTVNPVPDAITGIDNLCPGGSTTLFDITGGGVWSSVDSDAAPITSTGTVSAILAGHVSTISYTISNGCAATLAFSVNPFPYVGTIGGTKIFCMSSTTDLSDSVAGGAWSSNNTSVATISSAGVVSGITVGTATISYIVTEQCGMDTATTTVDVKPLPYAGPIQGSTQMCLHFSTTLADSAAGGIWYTTDPLVASIDSVTGTVYGENAGTATISYIYTNSCGSATASVLVTVNATFGFAHIVTTPDTPMCSNTLFQNFGALLPAPAGIAYHWSVEPAGDSVLAVGENGQYSIISFHTPGVAVVKLNAEVVSSGCQVLDSFVLNIGSSVSPKLAVQYYLNEFVCTENTQDSYQWGYDDITTMDSTILIYENNQTYYNAHPDTFRKNYWVMTTKNGCSQKTYYTFNLTTGTSTVPENNVAVNLFPNPADSRVNIVVNGLANGAGNIDVKLMDMFGKEVQTSTLINGKGTLMVGELPSGVYSVLLTSDGVKIGSKVFVKN